MCGSQLERLKRAIEERKINNIKFSKGVGITGISIAMFEGSVLEDNEILHMIDILERNG